MSKFRAVYKSAWQTAKALHKDHHHREAGVLVYLESAPEGNFAGVFYVAVGEIARATGLDAMEVQIAITNLKKMGLIVYDFDRRIAYVKGLLIRQLGGRPNVKHVKGVINILDGLPEESPAVQAFINEHLKTPELAEALSDRVSDRVSDTEREEVEVEVGERFITKKASSTSEAKPPPGGAASPENQIQPPSLEAPMERPADFYDQFDSAKRNKVPAVVNKVPAVVEAPNQQMERENIGKIILAAIAKLSPVPTFGGE